MTISEKIRELARDGFSTADIARQLGIRYQHAYNILKADRARIISPETVSAVSRSPADRVAAIDRISVPNDTGRPPLVVEGYRFTHVTNLVPVRMTDGAIQAFMPQSRYVNKRGLPLNKFGNGPFCKFTVPRSYQRGGVYLLMVGLDVRYVGECANLSARFNNGYGNISPKNCYKGGQETNCRINHLIYVSSIEGEVLSLFFHETADYKSVEAQLRAVLCAPWNRV
jgi:hypothetical protein